MIDIEKAKSYNFDSESIEVMEKANANESKRNSCKMHEFGKDVNKYGQFTCKNCGCEENSVYVNGYNDALRHAREL